MKDYDVLVIGAGPAGCATALFLAQRGVRVGVLDQARFPRDKVCGEFISPAADDLLSELGVLKEIEAIPPVRLRGVAISAYGGPEVLFPYPEWPGRSGPVTSLSLSRFQFDHLLVRHLQDAGVFLHEGFKVSDLTVADGCVTGVRGFDAGRTPFALSARLVIDAGGRNAVSLRQFDLKRKQGHGRKIALAAHWQGAALPGDYCYMHISRPGYTGISAAPEGLCNVVLVLDHSAVRGRDLDAVYREVVLANPRRRAFLQNAGPVEAVRSVDSLAFAVDSPPVGGLMLVGDAMGFIDPFTGEGVYLSLRSAQLAAETAALALEQGDVSCPVLSGYDRRRHREFHNKFLLSRILQKLIYNKTACRAVVRLLEQRPDLAQPLIGVIGDYLPAERVVRWNYLLRVLAGWVSSGLERKNKTGGLPAFRV